MGVTPPEKDLTIEYECQFRVTLTDVHLTTLLKAFTVLLPKLLPDFRKTGPVGYGELVMARKKKPFACDTCGNEERFIWKTRCGKPTKVLTALAWVTTRQLQVQCSCCGRKLSLTRTLLGLDRSSGSRRNSGGNWGSWEP